MHHLYHRLATLLMALAVAVPSANATTTAAPPAVRAYVLDGLTPGLVDQQVFAVPAAPMRPLVFGATIKREAGSPPIDVYLGVVAPGGKVFTWVPTQGGGGTLTEGMSAAARNMTSADFATPSVFGTDPRYTFTERDAPGLYSVFALLVPAGADPTDAQRWTWVNMVPLLFQGLTIQ